MFIVVCNRELLSYDLNICLVNEMTILIDVPPSTDLILNCLQIFWLLKSLGPIDRKFHGHGENDGFVLYEHIIKQFSSFCKHTNSSDLKKKMSNKITCKQ